MTEHHNDLDDASARGAEILRQLGWDTIWETAGTKGADTEFRDFTRSMVFGQLYGRDGMSLRDRELVVMALILAQGSERGIVPHFRQCHSVGISERDVRELIYTVCVYGGWPKGSQAAVWFNRVLQEPDSTWPQSMRVDPPLPPTGIQSDP
jgi:4-carboxymuconolactone decarboxylase